ARGLPLPDPDGARDDEARGRAPDARRAPRARARGLARGARGGPGPPSADDLRGDLAHAAGLLSLRLRAADRAAEGAEADDAALDDGHRAGAAPPARGALARRGRPHPSG